MAYLHSIIQGMKGEADLIKDGIVTMAEPHAYVDNTVIKSVGGQGHPIINTPEGYGNFNAADMR